MGQAMSEDRQGDLLEAVRSLFEADRYDQLARDLSGSYASAEPFPHVVTDDFLPRDLADRLLEEFPDPAKIDWKRQENPRSKKLSTEALDGVNTFTYQLLNHFNSPAALHFLERLTGIRGLVPDPYFVGGGLHQIERDGYLKVHADFNMHPTLKLDRRINLLLYMNKDWKEEYGGHLELWDRTMSKCIKKVLPVFNRCVVFNTLDWAYHGHPEPLTCPPGWTRKSLALYYYTNGRPPEEKSAEHGTLYQSRPGAAGTSFSVGVRRVIGGTCRVVGNVLAAPGRMFQKLGKSISPSDL
jgi:Rps23 Pro-64 3,4-dihydroxylase Tpa1-like proline 4-hydroxylase